MLKTAFSYTLSIVSSHLDTFPLRLSTDALVVPSGRCLSLDTLYLHKLNLCYFISFHFSHFLGVRGHMLVAHLG